MTTQMRDIAANISAPRLDDNALLFMRRRFIEALAFTLMLMAFVNLAVSVLLFGNTSFSNLILSAALLLCAGLTYTLIRRDAIYPAAYILISVQLVVFFSITATGFILIIGAMLAITTAALAHRPVYLLVNVLLAIKLALQLLPILVQTGLGFTPAGFQIVTTAITIAIISITTRFFINSAQRTAQEAARTAALLRSTAEIGQVTANLLKQEELFSRAVEMIRDRFAFYHVQIFVVDEDRKFARLVASTGEIGQKLLARGHKLAVGSQSVIGRVTQIGETVVARDTDSDAVHAVNELLPATRSELALPIVDGDRIIGALDVQSTRRDAFTISDIQALQVMTNQLATVIRNARLFEEREANVQLSQRLLIEARTNLREIQRLNSQLSKKAWDDYLETKQESGVEVRNTARDAVGESEWTREMVEAVNTQRAITRSEGTRRITSVPIILRGEALGAIEVEAEDLREMDLAEMVQAVAQNLATTLESARLFEEAQEAAAQEQRINTITEKYQAAATIDDLLKITMDELSRTFGSEQGVIRVGSLVQPPPPPAALSNGAADHPHKDAPQSGHRMNGSA